MGTAARSWRMRVGAMAAALLLALAPAGLGAFAQTAMPKVPVRAGNHPTYSRLVFDWPADVSYTVQRDGGSVTVLFDKPGDADLGPASRLRLANVGNLEAFRQQANGNLAVTFAAPADSDVRDFRNGRSVVIDVLGPGTRRPPAAATAATEPPRAAQPASPQAAAPAATPPAAQQPAGQPPRPPAPSAPQPTARTAAPPAATPPAATPPAAAAPASPAAPAAATVQSAAQPPAVGGPVIQFDPGAPSGMAVYPRAGHLYMVFDRALPIGAGRVLGSGGETLGPIEPVPATGGSAFRTRIGPFVWPKVERQGTAWRITPSTRLTSLPPQELTVVPEPGFLLGARLLIQGAGANAVVQLTDPEVGDRLLVAPVPNAPMAVTESRRYADVEFLPAFQGAVVRPRTDAVSVRALRGNVEIGAAGGLHLSPVADTGLSPVATAQAPTGEGPAAPPPRGAVRRLFDLPGWQHGGIEHFTDARQDLQMAAAEAPDDLRPRAQLDLAKFYLAHGFGPEALGMLDVVQTAQPDLEGWPEFRALRGAARVLAGDLDGASEDLAHPTLADQPEAALWRAAIAAERGDWPAAYAGFRAGSPVMASYPEPVLSRLSLLAAETALKNDDPATAQRLVDRMLARSGIDAEERGDIQYLRGELYRQAGDPERAAEQFRAAYNGLDRLYRTKAGLALVNLQLAEKHMSPPAAVERLAGLTFTWRGDDLETAIRQRLGEVQVAAGQYAEGFNTMKETAALVAGTPKAEEIARAMSRTFADIFRDGGMRLPTLEALKLYDQFRELTPVGPDGDELIRQLAERLIPLDLLDRAAALYQHQVEYRLSGQEKAEVGTRLASIRLLDRKPEEALKALEMSNIAGMPPKLIAERRTMQAKALAELGRTEEALRLLADDDTRPADLLRVDIAWRGQKWDQAAVALGKVIGDPPAPGKPLEPERSQLVLNRAVALALAGDGTGLNLLRKDFGGAMAAGPDADAFRVLTRPEQATGLIDVETIRSRVAEVDVFKNFLRNYRARQAPGGGEGA